jgi:hypothetical protein
VPARDQQCEAVLQRCALNVLSARSSKGWMLLFLGILLLIVWAVIALAVRRPWQLWERPLRRISEIRSAELVKISGRARARTSERVYAPLSGEAVLFFSFEGMATRRNARKTGKSIYRRAGVPFVIDDGSGVLAFVPSVDALQGSSSAQLTVLEWEDPRTVAELERRLAEPLRDAQRLQGRELTVNDGQQVTLIAQAQRETDLVMLSPALGGKLLLATETEPSMNRQIARGRRLLRAMLAAGVLLVAAGAWLLKAS